MRWVRHIIITAMAFVLVLTFALMAYNLPFMSPIEEAIKEFEMTDVYYHILQDTDGDDREVSDVVTIVDMSELYSRRQLAEALEEIEECGPRMIGVDVVFEGLREDSLGDEMIAETALSYDNIVFSYKLLNYANDSIGYADAVHSFFAGKGDVHEGFTNMQRNLYGGIKRQLSLGRKLQGEVVPSFIVTVANLYEGRDSAEVDESDLNINFIPLTFRVLTPDSISAHPEWIKDRLVLFGAMKEEGDMHYTPLGKMAGAELLAYSIETLLRRSEVRVMNDWLTDVLSFLIVLLTQVLLSSYTTVAKARKNRVARFLLSASFMKGYLMFFWIAVWMWIAFILFCRYDITLNIGWALSAMAFLGAAQSVYDEFIETIVKKN